MEDGAPRLPFRVWIDAQLPPAMAAWLTHEIGVEAVHIQELGLLRASDQEIFTQARDACDAGSRLVLVTKDDDFVRLLERLGPPPQVAWVTAGNMGNEDLRRLILGAWPKLADLFTSGEALAELGRPR
jgi:predicted nuclease of predicted toxin-antitoxin system